MQVNDECDHSYLKGMTRTSFLGKTKYHHSRPTVATVLVDFRSGDHVDAKKMRDAWYETALPWTLDSKNKGRIDEK